MFNMVLWGPRNNPEADVEGPRATPPETGPSARGLLSVGVTL